MRPVIVGLGELKVVLKAVELTSLELLAKRCIGWEIVSPSHETIVIADQKEAETCQ
jgi:hypothetical protein